MPKRYILRQMRKEELEELEQILSEQIEIQAWYAIRFVKMWNQEIIITMN